MDPELARVVKAWPNLTDDVRRKTERAIRSRRSTRDGATVEGPRSGRGLSAPGPADRRAQAAPSIWRGTNGSCGTSRRVPLEGVAAVVKDFWRRGIKDRRGRRGGKPRPKPFSLHRTPYASFHRTIRCVQF